MSSSVELEPGGDPLIGHVLNDKYTVERLIGRGGMGHVYLATATENGATKDVVVKMIAPPLAQQPQAMARFEREAKRLDGLRHSNIVEMFDYGRQGGRAYIVMEWVDGELLSDYMARKGRLKLTEFVPIAAQILKGVGHAHSRDLMIRDIKPANVMLTERKGRANFVKIIDFGLAKMLEGDDDITKQHFIGTSGYLSPEQIKGLEIDLRVDVYAMGVLFYQMLSGRMPFEAENDTTLLYKHVHEFPTPLSEVLPADHEVPDELVHLIHDCLEKDPEARPHDANEIVEKLIDCVPMSMFKLPAVTDTAAHTSISALSTAALNAPTGQTATFLQRQAVDSGPSAVAAPDSAPGVSDSAPGVGSGPSFAIAAEDQSQGKSKLGLIIGGVAVAALLVVGAMIVFGGDKDEGAGDQAAVANKGAELEGVVKEAEELVAAGDFDGADRKLDPVRGQLGEAPSLAGTVDRLDKQIEIGRLMATAKQLDADNMTGAAISAYEAVLAVDPANAEARKRIDALHDSVGSDNGLIEISSDPAGNLKIDGAVVGNTPYGKPLPLGEHTIEIDVDGYEPWSTTIEIKAGNNTPVDIKLTKLDGGGDEDDNKTTKKKPSSKPSDETKPKSEPVSEPDPKPETKNDNPFMDTSSKKKKSGPFL